MIANELFLQGILVLITLGPALKAKCVWVPSIYFSFIYSPFGER
jgi:hypothetical protein